MNTIPKQYRKKPVVIDAMQWDGTAENAVPVIDWILNGGHATYDCTTDTCSGVSDNHAIAIRTLEGTMEASPGDYIIKGVQGEFYPCKPDIFAATYEAVTP
jgi:hypothetical protein